MCDAVFASQEGGNGGQATQDRAQKSGYKEERAEVAENGFWGRPKYRPKLCMLVLSEPKQRREKMLT